MRVIWKKVVRDIWHHKSRAAMVVLSIAVGVFAIGFTLGILETLGERLSGTWRESHPSQITIGVGAGVTDEMVHFIGKMPGVESAEGLATHGTRWKADPAQDTWESANVTARTDFYNQTYDRLALSQGNWPERGGAVVERGTVSRYGVSVGDTVYIEASGRPRPLTIVGVAYDATTLPPLFTNEATFFVVRSDLERLGGLTTYTHVRAGIDDYSYDKASTTASRIIDRLERLNVDHGPATILDPQTHFAQEIIDGLVLILVIMSFLALGLSLMLVVNTMTAIITEQIPQIGIMKAVGATSGRIFLVYLAGVAAYLTMALAIAIPLGILASYAVSAGALELFNVEPGGMRVSMLAVASQLALGLIAPPLASLWPLVTGARITVRDAVSTYGLSQEPGAIARWLSLLRSVPRLVMITVANTFRRRWRLVFTQVALVGGGAVFIMVMSVRASLLGTFEEFTEIYNLDIMMAFDRPHHIETLESEIKRIPGVTGVEGMEFLIEVPVRRPDDREGENEENITLIAMSKMGSGYTPRVTAGRWLLPQDRGAIALNQHIAQKLGVGVGDEVVMEFNDQDSTWAIVGLTFDLNDDQSASAAWIEDVSVETGSPGMGSILFIHAVEQDTESMSALAETITVRMEERGRNVLIALTGEEWQSLQVATAMTIVYMLGAVGLLVGIVGAVGLSGTLSLNALERQKEIAIMRAIGASGKAIGGMFVGEGVLIGLISWLISIPLSIPLSWVFNDAIGSTIQVQLLFRYSIGGLVMWLALIVVLAAFASGLPAWRAAHTTVREALAYE